MTLTKKELIGLTREAVERATNSLAVAIAQKSEPHAVAAYMAVTEVRELMLRLSDIDDAVDDFDMRWIMDLLDEADQQLAGTFTVSA